MTALNVAVVVATKGRPAEVAQLVTHLASQTQAPSAVVLSITGPADLPTSGVPEETIIVRGPGGLPAQRNRGMAKVSADADIIAFFDDDYLPSRQAIEGIAALFAQRDDVVGANGMLLADGAKSPGISYDDAVQMLVDHDSRSPEPIAIMGTLPALYGCNMVFRASAIGRIRFDEALPLYGWQEDFDFSNQLERHGLLVHTNAFTGVHRGSKGAKTSGFRLGYSQIANPYYLARKGTMSWRYAAKLACKNLLANHFRALKPEPWVDRWGRVRGNWLAVFDLLQGHSKPGRIMELD